MNLSDAQVRSLIALVDLARDDRVDRVERRWHDLRLVQDVSMQVKGIGVPTARVLEHHGLIEVARDAGGTYFQYARATDSGVALCASMGD